MKINVVGGMAQVGKTSALKYLSSKGLKVLSTSQKLDEITGRFIKATFCPDIDLEEVINLVQVNKDKDWYGRKTGREWKIKVAEEVLVPVLGRHCLIYPLVKQVTNNCIIESIGGEEGDILIEELEDAGHLVYLYNIVKDDAPKIDDIRVPLKYATTITNNSSWEDFYSKLDKIFLS